MFPTILSMPDVLSRLPHAGGGVSMVLTFNDAVELSSPRRWGCFHTPTEVRNHVRVFPTQVGVFLKNRAKGTL